MYPFCREVRNIKSKTYEEFVEKFKPKKTTDDCYTPSEIYEVIKDWVCKRYNIDPENVIRPFWPGGDCLPRHSRHYPARLPGTE